MSKGIYCYIDGENDKIVYVGKDSNIDKNKRHRDHLAPSSYNAQPINRILQNNPNRYKYCVLWEIDDCTDNHLTQMEIFYIKKYGPKFNFTEGGGGISGFTHSEETRKKISENNARYWKGKTLSEETRKKISEAKKGKKPYEMTEETRKKMSESHKGENHPMYGKKHSEETRKKMSEAKKGKKPYEMTEETRKKISEANKGKNNPMYGKTPWNKEKTLSDETRKKMSEAKNTTGFYRVTKQKKEQLQARLTWRYQYLYKSTRKVISSADLKKLEEEVKKEGLEWEILDEEKAKKSLEENNKYHQNVKK